MLIRNQGPYYRPWHLILGTYSLWKNDAQKQIRIKANKNILSTFYLIIFISLFTHLIPVTALNKNPHVCYLCSESTKGSEPCGASEKEDERAGVVAASAFPDHSFPHPQQTWKGALLFLSTHPLSACLLLRCLEITTRWRHASKSLSGYI